MNFIDFVKELINNGEVEDSTLENITTLDSSDAVILNTLRSSENKLNEQVAKYISGVGFFDASETKKSEKTSKKISESRRARSSISRGTINKNLKSENKLKENEELDRDYKNIPVKNTMFRKKEAWCFFTILLFRQRFSSLWN